tara:strand:- start:249 stop:674 length:426 start_codon:yes stop_codon:yes gene_type:complete
MNNLYEIFIFISELAIPPNDILSIGLGTIIKENKNQILNELIDNFIIKYSDLLFKIIKIVNQLEINDKKINFEILIKEIKNQEIKSSFAIFLREYSILSSQIYFSNSLVLKSYDLLQTKNEINQTLNQKIDYEIFEIKQKK